MLISLVWGAARIPMFFKSYPGDSDGQPSLQNHCGHTELRTFVQPKDHGVIRKVIELALDLTWEMEN